MTRPKRAGQRFTPRLAETSGSAHPSAAAAARTRSAPARSCRCSEWAPEKTSFYPFFEIVPYVCPKPVSIK